MKHLLFSGAVLFSVFMQAEVTRFDIVQDYCGEKTVLFMGYESPLQSDDRDAELINDHLDKLELLGMPMTLFFENTYESDQTGNSLFFKTQSKKKTKIQLKPVALKETLEQISSSLIIFYGRRAIIDKLCNQLPPRFEPLPIHRRKELFHKEELPDLLSFFAPLPEKE